MLKPAEQAICPACAEPIQVDVTRPGVATLCECGGDTGQAPPFLIDASRILAIAAALPGGAEIVPSCCEDLPAQLWQTLLDVYDAFADAAAGDGYDDLRHDLAARIYQMVDLG